MCSHPGWRTCSRSDSNGCQLTHSSRVLQGRLDRPRRDTVRRLPARRTAALPAGPGAADTGSGQRGRRRRRVKTHRQRAAAGSGGQRRGRVRTREASSCLSGMCLSLSVLLCVNTSVLRCAITWAQRLKRSKASVKIYDPYYCEGLVVPLQPLPPHSSGASMPPRMDGALGSHERSVMTTMVMRMIRTVTTTTRMTTTMRLWPTTQTWPVGSQVGGAPPQPAGIHLRAQPQRGLLRKHRGRRNTGVSPAATHGKGSVLATIVFFPPFHLACTKGTSSDIGRYLRTFSAAHPTIRLTHTHTHAHTRTD